VELTKGHLELRSDRMTQVISSLLYERFGDRLVFSKFAPNYYGSEGMIQSIRKKQSWEDLMTSLDLKIDSFRKRRKPHLLYPESDQDQLPFEASN
jgi:hypothetical protein